MIGQGHRSDLRGPHHDSSAVQLRGLCHRVTRQFPQDLGLPWVMNGKDVNMEFSDILWNCVTASSFRYCFGFRKRRHNNVCNETQNLVDSCWLIATRDSSKLHFDTFRRTCEEEWSTLMFFCDYQGHWLHLYGSLLINHRRDTHPWRTTWRCCNSGKLNLWWQSFRINHWQLHGQPPSLPFSKFRFNLIQPAGPGGNEDIENLVRRGWM